MSTIHENIKSATTAVTSTVSAIGSKVATASTAVQDAFTKTLATTINPKHQKYMVEMLRKATSVNDVLATDIYERIKGKDVVELFGFHRDLNLLSTDETLVSSTFTEFKGFLDKTLVAKLLKIGRSPLASKNGGKAHAEIALNIKFLEGMRKGVELAIQGKHLSEADKQAFLKNNVVENLKQRVAAGETDTVLEAVKKISADPILGSTAKSAPISKELAKIVAQVEAKKTAEKQAAIAAEKAEIVKTVTGSYVTVGSKLKEIEAKFKELAKLEDTSDATVAEGVEVTEQVKTICDEIVKLVKEIDPNSTISAAHIVNPISKNIEKDVEKEILRLRDNDLAKAEVAVRANTVQANQELISRLKELQKTRTMTQFLAESVIGSEANKILAENTKNERAIKTLSKQVEKFEKVEAAKEAAKTARTWFQFSKVAAGTVASAFTRTKTLSAQEKLEKATLALDEFMTPEVETTFGQYETLLNNLKKVVGKTYILTSSRKAAEGKAQGAITAFATTNEATITKHAELVKAVTAAQAEVEASKVEAESVEEIVENVDFVIA